MSFLVKIREKARTVGKTVVLPEGKDERVVTAAAKIVELGVAKPVVLGIKEDMERVANDLGISLKGVEIIEIANSPKLDEYATKFAELRAKKGMTFEKAKEIMSTDSNFYGAMMVKMKDADAMVSGSDSPTADVLRAGLQIIGTKPGIKTVSSMFVMELTERQETYGEVLLFGDCSVIPVPTSEQLADIAEASVVTAKNVVGMEGKVALMTFSTKGSANHPDIDVVKEAGNILKERGVTFPYEAEIQADAAIVKSVAMKKCPESKVAGSANILVFPNLAAGNIGYKLVQRLAGANAYGPLIQGLASPINDLSRGCSVDDIVNLVAITAVQAAE
ncbi:MULTISPECIES: phosphate acetyltransferase [Fusobacterium]|uniref:Phosphate acetyltransferase n=2 Tax=Fusobacterium ulcerans TaxID=861 RepID=A0AAX1TM29_9FUSO|nr:MULTISPECIES: phosphate acetyltransferase [Fusobacterium]AVQ28607.1 phosphate acetyltransferase [Fusobacterium ulcerans]EFS26080.2 phosphate acetyltransferase [Fusobacterium ulcerans ATCC 49185]EHO80403.1 phosphate acetyltransferase [Fusobacterium ulcerans 12-1B]MCB8566286.1 phosphate acetyltransferase [Fusobacterium ulcerans]MCB8650278.1 phosphate acetyltransferase [Fusobacterium ulcerans]